MKKLMMAGMVLAALPLAAAADVSKEDLKRLALAGLSEDVIRTYIKFNGPVARLSADDLIDLRKCGLSDRLLAELLVSSATAPIPAPIPAPAPAPAAPPVPVPSALVPPLPADPAALPSAPPASSLLYDGSYYYPPSYLSTGLGPSSLGLGVTPYFVGVPVVVAAPAVVLTTGRPATGHSTRSPGSGSSSSSHESHHH